MKSNQNGERMGFGLVRNTYSQLRPVAVSRFQDPVSGQRRQCDFQMTAKFRKVTARRRHGFPVRDDPAVITWRFKSIH